MGDQDRVRRDVEGRAGLGLERVADLRRVVDDRADLAERVGPVEAVEELEDPRDRAQRALRRLRLARVDGDVGRDPGGARAVQPEAADVDRGQVGRHRIIGHPGPGAVRVVDGQLAVRDRLQPLRRLDRDPVGRLVGRRVVARKPGRGALGLAERDHPVVGGDPAIGRAVGVDQVVRFAAIADRDDELRPRRDSGGGGDHQLLALAAELGRVGSDVDRLDPRPAVVEVEPAQVMRGGCGQDRRRRQPPLAGLVAQFEVVVGDVIAPVSGLREERITDPGRAGGEVSGRRRHSDRARDDDREQARTQAPSQHPYHRAPIY